MNNISNLEKSLLLTLLLFIYLAFIGWVLSLIMSIPFIGGIFFAGLLLFAFIVAWLFIYKMIE